MIVENHREEEDQEGNNSPKIETLPLFPIHGGSHHDFFGVKALDLSSDHSVGGYYTARMVEPHLSSLSTHMDITTDFNHREEEDQEGNNSPEIETLPLFPIHGGSHHDFLSVKATDLSSDHSVGENHREEEDQEGNNSSKITTDFLTAENEPRGIMSRERVEPATEGSDVPRTLPQQIGMPRLRFGMITGTNPELLKIAKTGQRARSYASRDPGHLLAFEIRW
ncbi:hypothetical protein Tco_1383043 [Tanacetum coccineum]